MAIKTSHLQGSKLAALMAFNITFNAAAHHVNDDIRADLILDAQSGEIYTSYNANERRFPASTTKMMTLALLFEHMRAEAALGSNISSQTIKASPRAAQTPPSSIRLRAGDELSYETAINAIMIKSANDVAVAIAEHVGGSVENFVRMMNERAKEWHMNGTNFTNPSGLPNKNHYTTACDMAKMTLSLLADYPEFKQYPTSPSIVYNDKTYQQNVTMQYYYPFVELYKGGYIKASQRTLIAATEREGHRLIGVSFGIPKDKSIYYHLSKQFNSLHAHQVKHSSPEYVAPTQSFPAQNLTCD